MADITVGFRVQLPEIFTQSADDYAALHMNICKAIKLLPVGTRLLKQDWFIQEKYKPDEGPTDDFLEQAFRRHMIERPYLNHHCYLYITKLPKNRQKLKSNQVSLTRSKLVPREQMSRRELQPFFDAIGQFERIMLDGGIKMHRLTNDQLVSEDGKTGIVPNYFRLQPDGKKKVVLEDWDIENGRVRIGEKEVLCYTLSDVDTLPQVVEGMANYGPLSSEESPFPVGNVLPVGLMLPYNHVYNQYICLDDPQAVLREFEQTARHLTSFSKFSTENAINKEWHTEYIQEAKQNQRTICRAHFNLMVWTDRPEQLDAIRNHASSSIAQLDCIPKLNTQDAARLLWAGIPGNSGDLPFDETFFTFIEQAGCFMNLETSYQSSLSPFGIRLCDRFGKPVQVDLSDEPMAKQWVSNRNKFVLGPSGSGKSFFMNSMVRQYYEQKTHIVMVDVGHSYKGTCELINRKTRGQDGIYLTHSEENPISFNPFYSEDGVYTDDKIASINNLILTLWKKETENTSRTEEVALADAIQEFIRHLDKRPEQASFNGFYEFVDATDGFRAFLDEKRYTKQYFDVEQFIITMQPFYKGGKYSYLLNSNLNIDLFSKRFIVFELDNIKDHPILFPIVTLIIMETFVAKISRLPLTVRKMIIIEEAWKAIAKASMALYMVYIYKTIRKYKGEAIVVTQEINDIISNDIVKDTIISQSDCKILLNQVGKQVDNRKLQQLVGLTEKQMQLYLSVNRNNDPTRKYKEVFIALGGRGKVYGTEVSPEEYGAFTTEGDEKAEVQQRMARNGGDINRALLDFADARRKPELV